MRSCRTASSRKESRKDRRGQMRSLADGRRGERKGDSWSEVRRTNAAERRTGLWDVDFRCGKSTAAWLRTKKTKG
ncbi:hypothetical protein R1flu_006197 [Riccia fluitans]|uniref:Uncharacterized protein n=1 Tax=Riccia fluitans TaxID=41844 RepID=A0ABD1YW27_9MARC